MFQHALGENLTSPRIELKRAREKASSEELQLRLVVRIGNLVDRFSSSAKRPRKRIEQVFVSSAKNLNDPILSRCARKELEQILAIVECEYVERPVDFQQIDARLKRIWEIHGPML